MAPNWHDLIGCALLVSWSSAGEQQHRFVGNLQRVSAVSDGLLLMFETVDGPFDLRDDQVTDLEILQTPPSPEEADRIRERVSAPHAFDELFKRVVRDKPAASAVSPDMERFGQMGPITNSEQYDFHKSLEWDAYLDTPTWP